MMRMDAINLMMMLTIILFFFIMVDVIAAGNLGMWL